MDDMVYHDLNAEGATALVVPAQLSMKPVMKAHSTQAMWIPGSSQRSKAVVSQHCCRHQRAVKANQPMISLLMPRKIAQFILDIKNEKGSLLM